MSVRNIFKPTKGKIISDFIFSAAIIALFLSVPSFGFGGVFAGLSFPVKLANIAISLLIGMIIYYPLICGFAFFSRFSKKSKKAPKEKPRKLDIVIAVLLVLIFNPITLGFVYSGAVFLNHAVLSESCGMQITDFAEPSPAKDAGINAGETITSIDNAGITNSDSLLHVLAAKKPGDVISITTNAGNYSVVLAANPSNPQSAFLGIKLREKYCAK